MTSETIIRKIYASENNAIAALIRDVFHELNAPKTGTAYNDPTTDYLYEKFKTEGSVLFVAEVNGQIAGCCGIYPTEGLPENYAELVRFFISNKYRGKGIGKALMQECTQWAKEFGYSHLYLESIPEFDKAIGIYESLGYKHLPAPLGNTGHTTCSVWMLKDIGKR